MGIVAGILIVLGLAFRLSPWPGALVIRSVFERGGHNTLVAMQKALPDYPVAITKDVAYGNSRDMRLDVYRPERVVGSSTRLPIIIWTHGGAWLSGDKKDAAPYFERLADQGYVVVAVNYSLAPGATYPTAVRQLNDAHRYIVQHSA